MAKTTSKKPGTALIPWEQELAADAAKQSAAPASGGERAFFSISKGTLKFDGAKVKDNKTDVVILDFAYVNAFYPGAFKEGETQSPVCSAIARDKLELAPDNTVEDKQSDECAGCPQNEFGSKGDGSNAKACGNKLRLAVISAAELEEPEGIANAQIAYIMVPPTSLKAFGNYFKETCEGARGVRVKPIYAVATTISLDGFALSFEEAEGYEIDRPTYTLLKAKVTKMGDDVLFPFPKFEETKGKKVAVKEKSKRKF